MTTIYITKYALTKGIQKVDVDVEKIKSSTFSFEKFLILNFTYLLQNRDFFYTESEALANAIDRKNKKLKSLQKQIEKLTLKEIKVV